MQEWEIFATFEPFPEDKIVQHLAHIASVFANANFKKKHGDKWTMEDFLLKYFSPPQKKVKKQTASQMKEALLSIAGAVNRKVFKKERPKRDPYKIKYEAQRYIPVRKTPPVNPVRGKR